MEKARPSSQEQKCVGSVVCDELHCNLVNLHVKLKLIAKETRLPSFLSSSESLDLFSWVHFHCSRCVPFWLPASPNTLFPTSSPAAVFTRSLHTSCGFVFANSDRETENAAPRRMCMSSRCLSLDDSCFEFGLNYWCTDRGANPISANQTEA